LCLSLLRLLLISFLFFCSHHDEPFGFSVAGIVGFSVRSSALLVTSSEIEDDRVVLSIEVLNFKPSPHSSSIRHAVERVDSDRFAAAEGVPLSDNYFIALLAEHSRLNFTSIYDKEADRQQEGNQYVLVELLPEVHKVVINHHDEEQP